MENPLYIDVRRVDLPWKGFARAMPALDGDEIAVDFVTR
jgi:hypothetical protein